MSSYGYGSELQCCKGVVDPITFLTMLAVIAAITIILRQAVLANIAGRRKKRGIEHKTERLIMMGESIRGDLKREHMVTCKSPLLKKFHLNFRLFGTCMLCISTGLRVLRAPGSGRNTYFQPFSTFFFI